MQKPAVGVGRVVEVDPDFEDGVGRYSEVAAEGGHGGWEVWERGEGKGERLIEGIVVYIFLLLWDGSSMIGIYTFRDRAVDLLRI